ncbi:hypothetical protein [Papillibacter cinnamivorans]|uniref:Permease family protein n=1 Tax=Papillibacter cinnamivorans DSM 12816 TaxID=1122930 RepID=A0A1W1YPA8_9FIRM|nr:hypothetical protein [Papillibacter cinnamivorans]SMC37952.1 hypothetical protein SAMN02745168_0579 [Papillibacter cinnamivorans DSM 12816]
MALMKRAYGAEQPYIPLGIFKVRFPFIHYRLEWPEVIQGLFCTAISAAAYVYHMENLGISFELAFLLTVINELLYFIHVTMGDPVCPGWITPAIPLTLSYLSAYAVGPERIQALAAVQIMTALFFFFFGITGLAKKIIGIVPKSMQAGILLGAGFSAVNSVIKANGRVVGMEISFWVGAVISLIVLYSVHYNKFRTKNKLLDLLGKAGIVPGMIAALIVGVVIGEIPMPTIQWGIFHNFDFAGILSQTSVFGIGWPSISLFLNCIPLVISIYIIAFGDFITSEALIRDADKVRDDEIIDFNPSRSNILSGIRNLIEGIFCPHVTLAGPLWGAGTIAVAERYKRGRAGMDSIFSGMGTLKFAMIVGIFITPLMSIFTPVAPVLVSLTLFVQGFASGYLAMEMLKTREERGCACIMGVATGFVSAATGLLVGLILHVLIGFPKQQKTEAALAEAEVK